jgi:hypothetical protein
MRDDNRLLLSSWSEMTVRRDRIGDRPCCDQNLSIIGPPTWKHGGGFRCRLCDRNVGWIKHSCAEIIRERLAAGEPMPFSMKEIEEAALAKSCLPPGSTGEMPALCVTMLTGLELPSAAVSAPLMLWTNSCVTATGRMREPSSTRRSL